VEDQFLPSDLLPLNLERGLSEWEEEYPQSGDAPVVPQIGKEGITRAGVTLEGIFKKTLVARLKKVRPQIGIEMSEIEASLCGDIRHGTDVIVDDHMVLGTDATCGHTQDQGN
jgi:hypothetical protein